MIPVNTMARTTAKGLSSEYTVMCKGEMQIRNRVRVGFDLKRRVQFA